MSVGFLRFKKEEIKKKLEILKKNKHMKKNECEILKLYITKIFKFSFSVFDFDLKAAKNPNIKATFEIFTTLGGCGRITKRSSKPLN